MTSGSGCEIAVFSKAPVAGSTKTRLIPLLGAAGAARLHCALLQQALETALEADIGRVLLWCTEDDPTLSDLATTLRVPIRRQCAGDLGQRMSHTFAELLAHAASVILVGSDCPVRGALDFQEAGRHLASGCEAVLGPTEDGGYHLIALRSAQPALFTEIDWSTPMVMEQTRRRMRALDLRWRELATRWDVDRPEDLVRLCADPQLAELARACT
jgi:rSAM/selenodomain-associated transferase 1